MPARLAGQPGRPPRRPAGHLVMAKTAVMRLIVMLLVVVVVAVVVMLVMVVSMVMLCCGALSLNRSNLLVVPACPLI